MVIGERLKEERNRMGHSQEVFGEMAGVSKMAQIRYEKGERSPDAAYLAAIAAAGADVLYILTGARSQAVAEVELLPAGDRILLDNFHRAPAAVQAGVKTTLGAFASTRPVKPRGKAA